MFQCPNCGRQLPDDSVFCEGCGKSVSKYGVVQPQIENSGKPQKKGKSLKMFALGALAVIAIAIVVGGFFGAKAISNSGSNNASTSASSTTTQESSSSSQQSDSSSTSNDASFTASSTQSQNSSDSQSTTNSTSANTSNNTGSTSSTNNSKVTGDYFAGYDDNKKTNYLGALLIYQDGSWFYFEGAKGDVSVFSKNNPTNSGTWMNNPKWDNVITFSSASTGESFNMAVKNMDNGEQVLNEIDENGKAKSNAPRYFWVQKITKANS